MRRPAPYRVRRLFFFVWVVLAGGGCSWDWDRFEPQGTGACPEDGGPCCPPEQRFCGGQCVAVSTSNEHCGECDHPCPRRCEEGQCLEVRSAALGDHHTCALLSNGGVYCWGANGYGQLGVDDSSVVSRARVPKVPTVTGALQVGAGSEFSCALMQDGGTVECWGRDDFLNLGGEPQCIAGAGCYRYQPGPVLDEDGGVLRGAIAMSCGTIHACALLEDHSVRCWGGAGSGQVGRSNDGKNIKFLPTGSVALQRGDASVPLSDVEQLSLGGFFSCALLRAGDGGTTAACWGTNGNGQLGSGGTTSTPLARLVGGELQPLRGLQQLASGSDHTCARLEDGGISCWGANASAQLGPAFDGGFANLPVKGPNLSGSDALAAGGASTCALQTYLVPCWGSNEEGQLGREPSPAAPQPKATNWGFLPQSIFMGSTHACAVTSSGGLRCWGKNENGKLGRPPQSPSPWDPADVDAEVDWE